MSVMCGKCQRDFRQSSCTTSAVFSELHDQLVNVEIHTAHALFLCGSWASCETKCRCYLYSYVCAFSGTHHQSKIAFVGETAHLSCENPAPAVSDNGRKWSFQPEYNPYGFYSSFSLTPGALDGRANITRNTLVINDIKKSDSGTYTCDELAGSATILTVRGKSKFCAWCRLSVNTIMT